MGSCRNVDSFLIYFLFFFLLRVCMAEEPPMGSCAIRYAYVCTCTPSRFFENQPNPVIFEPDKLQKKKEKKKERGRKEEKRKSNFALLVFMIATLEIYSFWPEKSIFTRRSIWR